MLSIKSLLKRKGSGKVEYIIQLLMRRDGISYIEAMNAYNECKAEMDEALEGTSCMDPEEILASELGLEPDYIIYFM